MTNYHTFFLAIKDDSQVVQLRSDSMPQVAYYVYVFLCFILMHLEGLLRYAMKFTHETYNRFERYEG